MSSEFIIDNYGLKLKEVMKKQTVIRVEDMYELKILNEFLDEGWRIVDTCIMPFMPFGVVEESSKYPSPITKTVGGYIDYILEKEVDGEESTLVPSSERSS